MVNSHFVHTLDIAPVKFAATSANVRLNSCGAALCLRVSELSLRCTGENYNFNATALGSELSSEHFAQMATKDYWDVYWGLTAAAKEAFDENRISIPFPQVEVHVKPVEKGLMKEP